MKINFSKGKMEQVRSAIAARISQGRGLGHGSDYKPWFKAYQISSRGNKSVVPCRVTGRPVHVMSELELRVLHKILRSVRPKAVDVREQYPLLPIEETLEIAAELNVRHPVVPRSSLPSVMTTDFLVDWEARPTTYLEPIYVKPKSLLDDRRTSEKKAIEEEYWRRRALILTVATEDFISKTEWLNISWFHENREDLWYLSDQLIDQIKEKFCRLFSQPETLSYAANVVSTSVGLDVPTVIEAARYIFSTVRFDTLDGEPIYRSSAVVIEGATR